MIDYIEPFLVNFSFIVIPFFLYQMFWVSKGYLNHKKNKMVMVIVQGITIILCMSYPMQFSGGFIYDLRFIPFILGVLYGGCRVGIPLYIIILIYRTIIGGGGLYITLIVTTVLLVVLILMKRRYKSFSSTKKMIVNVIVAVSATMIGVLLSHLLTGLYFISLKIVSLNYIVMQGIGMWLMTYLVEIMIDNVELHRRAINSEKLNVISELSASISHEVRNPMTVTKGFLQLLKDPNIAYEKRKSYAELSLTELERAEMIINDYLAMTKSHKEDVMISNLEADMTYVTNIIKPYSTIYSVEVTNYFNNELEVKYDRQQLRQALLNIMKNCVEAMPSGGKLKINTYSSNDKVIINIKDTGFGMSQAEIERLGTPYYTTKEKGTGLGMTVVFSAIHAMHGKLHIDSEKGVGTQFEIMLPSYVHNKS